MTALSAANHATHANPPLPFTRDAIIGQLQRQATNGPAYVQHSATKALAHLKGLYAEARYQAKHVVERAVEQAQTATQQVQDQASEQLGGIAARVAGLMNGTLQPTPEELAHFELDNPLDDEDHPKDSDDDPP